MDTAHTQFYPLVLVVGSSGVGKTKALQTVADRTGLPYINVNLQLSQRLLPLISRQRALNATTVLEDMITDVGRTILLDNLEMLFHPSLQLDPLPCLQQLARRTNTTIVATWNGSIEHGRLEYAEPGHPEWRQYPAVEFLWVQAERAA